MRKFNVLKLAILMAIITLAVTNCKDTGKGTGNENGNGNEVPKSKITPSMLISLQESSQIIQQTMTVDKLDSIENKTTGKMRTIYESEEYIFQIALVQDANSVNNEVRDLEKNLYGLELIKVDNIGDRTAYLYNYVANIWMISVFRGDFFCNIGISYMPSLSPNHTREDEEVETAWRIDILKQAATLAIKNLDEILETK
jgi:hypothetical protein